METLESRCKTRDSSLTSWLESFDEMFAAKTQTLHQMSRCYTLADPFYTNLFTQVSAVYFTVQGLV